MADKIINFHAIFFSIMNISKKKIIMLLKNLIQFIYRCKLKFPTWSNYIRINPKISLSHKICVHTSQYLKLEWSLSSEESTSPRVANFARQWNALSVQDLSKRAFLTSLTNGVKRMESDQRSYVILFLFFLIVIFLSHRVDWELRRRYFFLFICLFLRFFFQRWMGISHYIWQKLNVIKHGFSYPGDRKCQTSCRLQQLISRI